MIIVVEGRYIVSLELKNSRSLRLYRTVKDIAKSRDRYSEFLLYFKADSGYLILSSTLCFASTHGCTLTN